MAGEVAYVQVVQLPGGKYVWESRDERHNVIETSKQYGKESEAHQAGADAHPHQYDPEQTSTAINPHTGKEETTPLLLQLGPPVKHAIVNDGEPEYGTFPDGTPDGPATAAAE